MFLHNWTVIHQCRASFLSAKEAQRTFSCSAPSYLNRSYNKSSRTIGGLACAPAGVAGANGTSRFCGTL
ncbi:hypothetical protein TIFTF001_022408 [Ficus carica]|uniref:Uncharacterized protein n=1 Tax=Ficus carica TaxID=3494 RepID=A0AA88AEG0_FICCA|nr:hypothetical protein TIFTF001_022408 [Ficus carica]